MRAVFRVLRESESKTCLIFTAYQCTGTMNKILSLLTFSALVLLSSSCTNEEQEAEIMNLRSENQALQRQIEERDATLKVFEEGFTTIQRNLALISEREKAITFSSGDLRQGEDVREEITRDIQAINNLLEENKQTIDNLSEELTQYGAQAAGFKRMIDQLNRDIVGKEQEIAYLKENLTAANFTIEILNEMLDSAEFRNEIQADLIRIQSTTLKKAYYAIGTFKELSDNGVVEKQGDIIGIAGTKQLRSDFNKDFFSEIDITQVRSIPLNAKKVQIITNHPTESYELVGEEEKTLRILDPERFWDVSRFLVVVTG